MNLETTRFGEIEVNPDDIITFTQPILGFQKHRRYVVLPGPGPFLYWLQSTEDGSLAFILITPQAVVPDYEIKIGKAELAELGANDPAELDVYTLVVVPADPTRIRTNLKAPLLVNPGQRLGKQTVIDRADYPIQYYLATPQQDAGESRRASNARSDA
jgi:flagellar assembly factor FliW